MAEIAGDTPQLLLARELLGQERFARHIRAQAFDALRPAPNAEACAFPITDILEIEYLRRIMARAPSDCGVGERYCPRCAAVYRLDTQRCTECDGVDVLVNKRGAEQFDN